MENYSVRMLDKIMADLNSEGYDSEISKRWAYVPGMILLAFARAWEQYGGR